MTIQNWLTLCEGCGHLGKIKRDECYVYAGQEDRQHTRVGGCPMRTHNLTKTIRDDKKVNPLKASKRSQQEG